MEKFWHTYFCQYDGDALQSIIGRTRGTGIDFSNYTFDDLVESTAAIAEATGDYGWNDNNDNSTILQYFLRTKGEDLYQYDADGKPEIGFSKENWVEFMGLSRTLRKPKQCQPQK